MGGVVSCRTVKCWLANESLRLTIEAVELLLRRLLVIAI